ncbi:MAG: hypothetical protein ABMA14_07330 [Hyphomonadaceae bacterium]
MNQPAVFAERDSQRFEANEVIAERKKRGRAQKSFGGRKDFYRGYV